MPYHAGPVPKWRLPEHTASIKEKDVTHPLFALESAPPLEGAPSPLNAVRFCSRSVLMPNVPEVVEDLTQTLFAVEFVQPLEGALSSFDAVRSHYMPWQMNVV